MLNHFQMKFLLILQLIFCLLLSQGIVIAQTNKSVKKSQTTQKKSGNNTQTPKKTQTTSIGEFVTQARFALVIGNSSYPEIPLPNTINDASAMSISLRSIGFNVTEKRNLTLAEMRGTIEDFSRKLPADAVGLFFFAGHGLQVSGKNFLLPLDYKEVKTETDLLATQLDLDSIIASISKKSGLTIIVLDACRNNGVELALSFESEKGFTIPKQNSGGVYIAYSTSPGTTAYDGTGSNSPYTKALAQNLLLSPGRLEDIFIKTRIDVRNQTSEYPGGEQVPWENGSLSKLFYFTSDKLRNPVILNSQKPSASLIVVKPKLPLGITTLIKFSFSVPHLDNVGSRIGLDNKSSEYFSESWNSINLDMVEIPGGEFQMGSSFQEVENAYQDALKSNDEADREVITAEMPQHSVKLSGFFMSKFEVTQRQWKAVMGELPPNIPQEFLGDGKPVVNVTWKEAINFCDILSAKTKRNYHLPTESQWEYAARAGTQTPFAFGENINSNYVNFLGYVPFGEGLKGDYREKTVIAGQLEAPNNFGIYDVHGNVSEWCADYWHPDYNGAPNDGSSWNIPAKQKDDDDDDPALYRVIRGGSYESIGNNCRSAQRRARPITDDDRYSDVGFRVVVSQ